MTTKENFDKAIARIESEVKKKKSPSAIAETIAQEMGFSKRDSSVIFQYLTGKTLINYIKERKMVAACEEILDSSRFDIQNAITMSGLGDQPTFIKAFKRRFGCTPKEAFENKDRSIIKVKLSWNNTENTETHTSSNDDYESNMAKSKVIFGMDRKKYEEIREINDLIDVYSFDELQSTTAYDIHKKYNLPLGDTFRFVSEYHYPEDNDLIFDENDEDDFLSNYFYDSYLEEYGDYESFPDSVKEFLSHITSNDDQSYDEDDDEILWRNREEFYRNYVSGEADDPEIRYIYFDCGICQAQFDVWFKLHDNGIEDITEVDPYVVKACAEYPEIDFGYCKRAVDYYREHATKSYGETAFEEYMDYIMEGEPIEYAFDDIGETGDWDDFYDALMESPAEMIEDFDFFDEQFEKWVDYETDYSDKYRLFDEPNDND